MVKNISKKYVHMYTCLILLSKETGVVTVHVYKKPSTPGLNPGANFEFEKNQLCCKYFFGNFPSYIHAYIIDHYNPSVRITT